MTMSSTSNPKKPARSAPNAMLLSPKAKLAAAAGISLAGLAMTATPVQGQISFTGTTAYTQNFDDLNGTNGTVASRYNSGATVTVTASATSVMPAGWSILERGANRDTTLSIGSAGASGPAGDTYLLGTAGSTERALGGIASANLATTFGAYFTNNTGKTITAFSISYTGEQWRNASNATTSLNYLLFDYATGVTALPTATSVNSSYVSASDFIRHTALDFTSPSNATGSVTLNGNLTANQVALSSTISGLTLANGGSFFIRWQDANDAGSDHAMGIDTFSITPTLQTPSAKLVTSTSFTQLGTATVNATNNTYTKVSNVDTNGAEKGAVTITGDLATDSDETIWVYLDLTNSSDASLITLTALGNPSGVSISSGQYQMLGLTYDVLLKYASRPVASSFFFEYDFEGLGTNGIGVENIGVVPEPASLGLLGLGAGFLLKRRRRALQNT